MGQAMNRVLREALDALLEHLDAQAEQLRGQVRDLQERVEFIEKGYLPRQAPKGAKVKAAPKAAPKVVEGFALGKAVVVVEALLVEVGVGKSADDLAKPLGLSRSSSGRTVRAVQEALSFITCAKSINSYLYWIEGRDEGQARAWLSEQAAKASVRAQALPKPVNGVAVLTKAEGRFVLTLPTGKVYRAARARDLKYRAGVWGYSVDDRVEPIEVANGSSLAKVVSLRSV